MMKLILFIYLFSVSDCLASENYWIGNVDGYGVNQELPLFRPAHQIGHHKQHHHEDHVERPCPNHDEHCVRLFFAKNSKCTPTFGPAPDPYVMAHAAMDVPHANMTIETYNVKHIGFNTGKIKEFYINKKTDKLVLEVEFKKIIVDSPLTVMTYHRKGKEPIVAADASVVEFRRISLTLTVQHVNDLNPEKGHVYTHLSGTPFLKAGPGLTNVKGLSAASIGWVNNMGLTAREALLSQSPLYMAVYLQSKICDFRHV